MARVAVVLVASLLLIVGISSGPAESMGGYSCPPPSCRPPCPQRTLVTRMVPCMKTELVAEVLPCTRTVPVQMVGFRCTEGHAQRHPHRATLRTRPVREVLPAAILRSCGSESPLHLLRI